MITGSAAHLAAPMADMNAYVYATPNLIVVGVDDDRTARIAAARLRGTRVPVLFTSPEAAEAIPRTTEAFLAVKARFTAAVGRMCGEAGAEVMLAVGCDRRTTIHGGLAER